MTKFDVHDGATGEVRSYDKGDRPTGGNGGGGGNMEIQERLRGLELAQVQIGMDMQYLKGRAEDMPTKDWVNSKLLTYGGAIAALIVVCGTILGFLITSNFSAMAMLIKG